jgi:glutathione S-transferase
MIKLFTFATSPYARKVRMAMDYKNVPYEAIERCYSLDRKPDLKSAHERAEVPVVVLDDGSTIADSTVICEYLEDTYPSPPLLPRDGKLRAQARTLEDLCDRAFDAVTFGYWLAVVRSERPEAGKMQKSAQTEMTQLLARLEHALEGRDFLCGELSIADLAAVPHVAGVRAMQIKLADFPRLERWMETMREVPPVKADLHRVAEALKHARDLKSEFEGPDGRVHWRDSRLEWPIRHGFLEFVADEFRADKMMFPPDGV